MTHPPVSTRGGGQGVEQSLMNRGSTTDMWNTGEWRVKLRTRKTRSKLEVAEMGLFMGELMGGRGRVRDEVN